MTDKLTKMLADPFSGLSVDPITGFLSTRVELGSMELTALGAGPINTDAGIVAALSKPSLRKSCEDALIDMFNHR